jgi:hypothetical protein
LTNKFTIPEFKLNLSYEFWEEIFTYDNVDSVFNSFLNTYLRIFYHSFPLKKVYHRQYSKPWITTGIKISSQHKRDLYLLCRSIKNPMLKNHYKTYCRILTDVIKTAKKLSYDKLITNSKNKAKTLWNIIKTETKKERNEDGPPLNNNGKTFKEYKDIANNFNTYFTNTNIRMSVNNLPTMDLALNYLHKVFIRPFPCIQ